MTLTRIALAAVALLLALAAWVYWPETSHRSDTAKSAAPVRAPAVSAAPSPQSSPGSTPALPPPDTPLKDIRETLTTRALAGDAPSACRWAMELHRCTGIPGIRLNLKRNREALQNEFLSPYLRERTSQNAANLEAKLSLTERVCDGITAAETKVAWRYLLSAAESGHLTSMILFAEGSAMREYMIPSRSEAAEAWMLHREKAAGFLGRAIEAGDPRAVRMAAIAYERGDWFGEPLLTKDRTLAVAHRLALQTVSTREFADSMQTRATQLREDPPITAAEAAHAEKLAGEISAKMRARNVKDIDYSSGIFPGGAHSHCD